jgi:hypothetical protein
MPLNVKNWSLKELWHLYQDKELDLAPDYQRREAWNDKKRMVLIDSIARRIPINAITLYKAHSTGKLGYEVIDGKQRLTALIQFQQDHLSPVSESVKDLSEEEESEGKELAEKIMDKKWSELNPATRAQFMDYEVPVYVVEGSRASAVRAFRRMNADPYALNPQEIRNAVFKDSDFLKSVHALADAVDRLATGADHFLVEWGIINSSQWSRMQDLQLLSELVCLRLLGPQEARRTLDTTYEQYFAPRGKARKELKGAIEETLQAIKAARVLTGPSLKPLCLDSENHVYALIGALFQHGIPTAVQLGDGDLVSDVNSVLSVYGNEVLVCQQAFKDNELTVAGQYPEVVKGYASTLLGGQINGAKRRQSRIDAMAKLLEDRVVPVDCRKPSELQRKLVWARSPDKKCARCGRVVEWGEYDCGHEDAKAYGGRCVLTNLRVEHAGCNRKAHEH